MRSILGLHELGKEDVALAGGKGANLGELIRIGVPVPTGFVVTSDAYRHYAEQSGLGRRVAAALRGLDPADHAAVDEASRRIERLFRAAPVPAETARSIRQAYDELGRPPVPVAVRSSATAEDLPEASFAGQQLTLLNIRGGDSVIDGVRRCWASLYRPQAISYRAERGFGNDDLAIAVPVQRMVDPESAGIMFTVNPVSGSIEEVVIEAVWGLGEAAVSGMVTPDTYLVDKRTWEEVERSVVPQDREIVSDTGGRGLHRTGWRDVPPARRPAAKLSQERSTALARLGARIEDGFGCPQDVEWAVEGKTLFVLQARPVTTLS
jgi:pyruvate,water dikinase